MYLVGLGYSWTSIKMFKYLNRNLCIQKSTFYFKQVRISVLMFYTDYGEKVVTKIRMYLLK